MNELLNQITPFVMSIFTVIAGFIAFKVKQFIDEKITVEQQTAILRFIKATVDYVEQIGIELPGEAKFNLAKQQVVNYANEKGIVITENEIDVLIEAFVHNLKQPSKIELTKEG